MSLACIYGAFKTRLQRQEKRRQFEHDGDWAAFTDGPVSLDELSGTYEYEEISAYRSRESHTDMFVQVQSHNAVLSYPALPTKKFRQSLPLKSCEKAHITGA